MRIILKVLAAPCVAALTVTAPVLLFLFCYAVFALQIVSGLGVLIAIGLFILKNTFGGVLFLILSFLISPIGIPAIAEWLIEKLYYINYSLRDFITS